MELGRPLATVTPTLDADVLAVLAQHRASFTTGQVHRVLGRASEEGIRKVLRRLTEQGIVLADRVGAAYAYRLNSDHLAAPHVVALADLMTTLLARLEDELGRWPVPPVYAAVFGSTARGTSTARSDLDLLLVRPDAADDDPWEAQVAALAALATRWTGNDTRVLQYTESELASAARREDLVLADVRRDGLTVAGGRAWFDRTLRRARATA